MKYDNWDNMSETSKIRAIQHEIKLETHNGTTKDDLLLLLKWLFDQFDVVEEMDI